MREPFASHSFIPHTRLSSTSSAHDLRRYLDSTTIADLPTMNVSSRSRSSSATTARALRPQRPLPALPTISDSGPTITPRSLAQDDFRSPFQLLQEHPLSLLNRFHNVKRVSLEEGVPPPLRFDVPVVRGALDDPNALLPTHVLAVYDQDENTPGVPELPDTGGRPYSVIVPTDAPSLPATPILIPVNAQLWDQHFELSLTGGTSLSPDSPPPESPSEILRRRSRSSSFTPSSPSARRRTVLTLPVHILRVPSAKSLPLFLLAALRVLPNNCILPAILPRAVLSELPASPMILAQHLYNWFYPPPRDRESRRDPRRMPSTTSSDGRVKDRGQQVENRSRPSSLRVNTRMFDSTAPEPSTPGPGTSNRISTASTSSFTSTNSQLSYPSSSTSLYSPAMDEPVCALSDPSTAHDPDLRLLRLGEQNFGLWANALALSIRDPQVVALFELGWSVVSTVRTTRFNVTIDEDTGQPRPIHRARSRTPLPGSGRNSAR